MSDPISDVGKSVERNVKSVAKETKRRVKSVKSEHDRQLGQLKSAFAFDFVPGDPEGDARRAATKATLDQRVRESARRRSARYAGPKPGNDNILARNRGTLA